MHVSFNMGHPRKNFLGNLKFHLRVVLSEPWDPQALESLFRNLVRASAAEFSKSPSAQNKSFNLSAYSYRLGKTP
jgi:hypothetical protein